MRAAEDIYCGETESPDQRRQEAPDYFADFG